VTDDLPISARSADSLVKAAVDSIFARTPSRLVCDVQTPDGQWHSVYFADLISGAGLKNISDRAKTKAVKAAIAAASTGNLPGISAEDIAASVEEEFADTAGSVSGLSPDQWSSVQGLEFGRVLAVRPGQNLVPKNEGEVRR
jgi:proteasome-associated ATPase